MLDHNISVHFTQFINNLHLQPISYSSPRGGISQVTEKGDVTASFLLLQQARVTDSGQYACHSSVGRVANASVHIIRSE